MGFIAKDWDIFVTKNGGKNSTCYDLIAFNPTTETAYDDIVDKSMLSGVDSEGNEYKMLEVSKKIFYIIKDKLFNKYSLYCDFVDFEINNEHETIVRKREKVVPANLVKKGINGELSLEELDKIAGKEVEKGDYYNFDAFMKGILRFLEGKISKKYYRAWLILVLYALNANKFKPYSKKWKIYDFLVNNFDGHAFDSLEEEKELECNNMIAILKEQNHILQNINKSVTPPFYNDNNIVVYVNFAFCNQKNEFYRVCIANEKEKVFKIALLTNCIFLPNINYTFVDEDEMLYLTNTYYKYCFDLSINEYDYIGSLPLKD